MMKHWFKGLLALAFVSFAAASPAKAVVVPLGSVVPGVTVTNTAIVPVSLCLFGGCTDSFTLTGPASVDLSVEYGGALALGIVPTVSLVNVATGVTTTQAQLLSLGVLDLLNLSNPIRLDDLALFAGTYQFNVTRLLGVALGGSVTGEISVTPIPAALPLLGSAVAGLAGFAAYRRRRPTA